MAWDENGNIIPEVGDRTRPAVRTYVPASDADPLRSRAPDPIQAPTVKDLATVVDANIRSIPNAVRKGLPPAPTKGAIPAYRAAGKDATNPLGGSGGGVASPLAEGTPAEPTTVQRTYHDAEVLQSADGVFSFEVRQLASLSMVDANGAAVVFNFSEETP